MIEAQFLLGALGAFLDGPAQASGTGQFGKLSPAGAKGSGMRAPSYSLIPFGAFARGMRVSSRGCAVGAK